MKTKYIVFMALFAMLLNAPAAFSATLEGTIVSVKPGMLVVDAGGDNLEENFKIEHATEVDYFDVLEGLKLGDWVNISYWKRGNHKIAASIVKEVKGPGEF